MYCSQWFLTLFSYRYVLPRCIITSIQHGYSLPLEIVFRIFDNCLASGIEAIFGFALSLLQKNEAKLLSMNFDELVAFLNTGVIDIYKVS